MQNGDEDEEVKMSRIDDNIAEKASKDGKSSLDFDIPMKDYFSRSIEVIVKSSGNNS